MKISEITQAIESVAPLRYQESYDNCGLQIGDATGDATGVLLCLDVTEAIVEEAIERGCNMIVAHHPLIFSGLKRITGRTYVERTVQKAIKNDIAIYAVHTNLDNMAHGVNARIAQRLGLQRTRILSPMQDTLLKLYTYAPVEAAEKVKNALFAAGAGQIGKYSECSFGMTGTGTFKPSPDSSPAIGVAGGTRESVNEMKIEVLVPKHLERAVLTALRESHPYEEVAYELISLNNTNQEIGAGMIGELPESVGELDFLNQVKQKMKTACIRHTPLLGKDIKRVAVCGGAGSFLLQDAIREKADIFITGDFKYHQFFDADGRIIIADIGHFESEQFTPEIIEEILTKKFPNFAILLSGINTNPLQYFC